MLFDAPPLTIFGVVLLAVIVLWEAVWKGIAMWRAGRNNQLIWFVCFLIFNTAGILPIVYLAWFQKKPISAKKRR